MKLNQNALKDIEADFARLEQNDTDNAIFEDGIVDLESYTSAPTRILWILKEAVDEYGSRKYDATLIDENIRHGQVCDTLRKMAYAAYGILNRKYSWEDIPEFCDGAGESLKQVAIINVKKTAGNPESDPGQILEAFDRFKELIFKQVDAYQPDVVIFGFPNVCERIVAGIYTHATGKDYDYLRDSTEEQLVYTVESNRLYLWWYHPAYPSLYDKKYFTKIVEHVRNFRCCGE